VVQFHDPGPLLALRIFFVAFAVKGLTAECAKDSQSAQRNSSGKFKLHHYPAPLG
jgi:hypothetical protein